MKKHINKHIANNLQLLSDNHYFTITKVPLRVKGCTLQVLSYVQEGRANMPKVHKTLTLIVFPRKRGKLCLPSLASAFSSCPASGFPWTHLGLDSVFLPVA